MSTQIIAEETKIVMSHLRSSPLITWTRLVATQMNYDSVFKTEEENVY